LSVSLGGLIERMTNANQLANDEHDGTDEGIVDDGGFDKESLSGVDTPRQLTLAEIVKVLISFTLFHEYSEVVTLAFGLI